MEEEYLQQLGEQYRRMREEMKKHYTPARDPDALLGDDKDGAVGGYNTGGIGRNKEDVTPFGNFGA